MRGRNQPPENADDEPFALVREKLSKSKRSLRLFHEAQERRRQMVMFSGMDCQPGQMDLFETDGNEKPKEK